MAKKGSGKRSKGLGDYVEDFTKATGIKGLVDWFSEKTGVDCGCDKRKEKLNQVWRGRKAECLERDEYEFLGTVLDKNTIRAHEQVRINDIYKRVFNLTTVKGTGCRSCLNERMARLKAVYEIYEDGKA